MGGASSNTYPDVGGLQQQVSEGRVVLGGKDVVLGVNNVEAQRAELLHLHRLASVLPRLQVVPEGGPARVFNIRAKKTKKKIKKIHWVVRRRLAAGGARPPLFVLCACKHEVVRAPPVQPQTGRLAADVCLNN